MNSPQSSAKLGAAEANPQPTDSKSDLLRTVHACEETANEVRQKHQMIIDYLELDISAELSEEDFLNAYRAASDRVLVSVHERQMKASHDDMLYRSRS